MASYSNQTGLTAEHLLSNLAREKKTARLIGGVTLTAGGLGTAALFSMIKSDEALTEEEAKSLRGIGYIFAGFITGSGIITLALPTEAENHYSDVMKINDPVKREEAAYSSLVFCADRARTNRLISGVLNGAFALYFLTAKSTYYFEENYNTYWALLFAGAAGANLGIKSVEEKMLDRYHEGQQVSAPRSRFDFGWLPDGSVTAVYSYRF
ncbi:MAG: hypothetical protein GX050_02335 [Firmicutes bacterium]|nr:hypothetical protein [Bacillota bacterium]